MSAFVAFDADGVVVGYGRSNMVPEGADEVSDGTLAAVQGKAGLCKLVDGEVVDCAPVAPEPKPVVREAMGYALISALTDDQVKALTSAKAKDQRLLSARVDPWPEDNPKVARIAAAIGTTPKAWFDAALSVAG